MSTLIGRNEPHALGDDQTKEEATEEFTQSQEEGTTAITDYPSGLQLIAIVTALLLSMFLVALDMTIVATAIPKITDEFHSIPDIGWYAAAFFITLAVFQSLWGRAYTHLNTKLVYLTTVVLFEVGSLICAVSPNSNTLIVGRAIAGLGGAGITGGVYTIIAFVVPPGRVPAYHGGTGAVFSVASVVGPLIGGVFTDRITWRWCFYINLPIGGVAALLAFIFLRTPARPVPITLKKLLVVLNLPGIALSLGFTICFTIAMQRAGTIDPWSSPTVIGTLVGFVVMTILFAVVQWRSGDNAMLAPRLLKQRAIIPLCLFIFFLNATNFAVLYNLPQYFQVIKGVTPTYSGILNLPMIVTTSAASFSSGPLLIYFKSRYQPFLILGGILITAGSSAIYSLDQDSSIGKIVGYQILMGLGVGCSIQSPVTMSQKMVEPKDIAMVTAILMFFQLITGAIWVAGTQAVLTNRLVAALGRLAPNLKPSDVLAVGDTGIRVVFQGADLDNVLQAYMVGLKDSWAMGIALSVLTLLAALFAAWPKGRHDSISGLASLTA